MPHEDTSFLSQMNEVFDPSMAMNGTSQSCPETTGTKPQGGRQRQGVPPPFLTEDEARMWAKERQKKDNHNQSMNFSLFCSECSFSFLILVYHNLILCISLSGYLN